MSNSYYYGDDASPTCQEDDFCISRDTCLNYVTSKSIRDYYHEYVQNFFTSKEITYKFKT